MKSSILNRVLLIFLSCILLISCSKEGEPEPFFKYPIPEGIDPEVAARLTKRIETENYIFYYAKDDTVEHDRCEAYVNWAMEYLDVTLQKKIEFFKFRSLEEMGEALSRIAGGSAFPEEVAYATCWKWHNHECMHILAHYWASENYPPSFFLEGMAVAHEFDPYNDDWVSCWNRAEIGEPWIDIVKRFKSEGKLYPIQDLLESESFWELRHSEEEAIAYPQVGMFTAYLIETYGLEKMKKIYSTIDYEDPLLAIKNQLFITYNISLEQMEEDWLLWLEEP